MHRMGIGALPSLLLQSIGTLDHRIKVRLEGYLRVGDVGLVVGRIEIDAVPASGESDLGADATRCYLFNIMDFS